MVERKVDGRRAGDDDAVGAKLVGEPGLYADRVELFSAVRERLLQGPLDGLLSDQHSFRCQPSSSRLGNVSYPIPEGDIPRQNRGDRACRFHKLRSLDTAKLMPF